MKIVAVVGMPGSGKSLGIEFFASMDFRVLGLGDMVRERANELGVQINAKTLANIANEGRRLHGDEVWAQKLVSRIKKDRLELAKKFQGIVLDGARSLTELALIEKELDSNIVIISIHASQNTRFERMKSRGRGDDPEGEQTFRNRDTRELNYGLGNLVSLSHFMVINQGSKRELMAKLRDIYNIIIEKWQVNS